MNAFLPFAEDFSGPLEKRRNSLSECSFSGYDEQTNNNRGFHGNRNYTHEEDNRPRTVELFTASQFLNEQKHRQSEPADRRPGRGTLHSHEKAKVSISDAGHPRGNPLGTLDLVIAVPYTPNSKLAEPTLIAENSDFKSEKHSNGEGLQPKLESGKDVIPQPNIKYVVKGGVGGQRIVELEHSKVPKEFVCPISQNIMDNPVLGTDGQCYEKRAIVQWLETNGNSPVTKQPMTIEDLKENESLKARIRQWRFVHKEQRQRVENTAEKSSNLLLGDVQC